MELFLNNPNYELSNNIVGSLKIIPRELNVKIKNKTVPYGDEIKFSQDDYLIEENNLIPGDDPQLKFSTNGKNAGNYKISVSCANPNYNFNITESGILTITKRKITIELFEQNVKHSFPVKFDNNAYTVSEGEVLAGDNLNVNITADMSLFNQFGTFNLYATYDNNNYDVTFKTNQATVSISTLEIVIISVGGAIIITILSVLVTIKRRKRYCY